MIIIAGTVRIKAEHLDDLIEAGLEMSRLSEAEPGCISYRFYADLQDPTLMLVFEQWESAEALAAHFQQPHTQQFGGKIAGALDGPMQLKRYEVTSASDL